MREETAMRRTWGLAVGVCCGVLLAGCGGLGLGGNTSAFVGHWVLAGGPVVSCPSGTGVLTAIDDFTIVAGTDTPLVLNLKRDAPLCALDFTLINLTATLKASQQCTLPFDSASANVPFSAGELGGSTDGKHLNVSLTGSVTLQGEACSYTLGTVGTR
jgi:hypothetical protein